MCYFIQRWVELTDSRTMFSYQYTYHNLLSALEECIEILEKTLNKTYDNNGHLKSSINEIRRFLKNDILLCKNKNILTENYMSITNKSIKEDHEKRYLKARIEIFYDILKKKYHKWLKDMLIKSIEENDFENIEKCIIILVSYCIHKEWSLKGLHDLHKIFFEENNNNIENFIEKLYKFEDYYTVFIPLEKNWNNQDIEKIKKLFEFEIGQGKELINRESCFSNNLKGKLNEKIYYCQTKLKARDSYSAALKAIEKHKKSIELLFFYEKIETGKFIQNSYNVYEHSNNTLSPLKLNDIYRTFMKINDSNSIYEYTCNIFENNNLKLQKQLKNALTYANISKTSPYQEEKFLNLWIALESFMNTKQYGNIIEHVKNVLPSVMSRRYFYRIIRNLYEDLKRVPISFSDLDDTINENIPKAEIVEKIINLIKDKEKFQKLVKKVHNYTLMENRLNQVRKIVTDTNEMNSKIKNYIDTIEWHVQRMYRLRNDITHDSMVSENDLTPFIEHLHDFLATTITEIVILAHENNQYDLNHIFATITTNISIFSDKKNKEIFPFDGIIECLK